MHGQILSDSAPAAFEVASVTLRSQIEMTETSGS